MLSEIASQTPSNLFYLQGMQRGIKGWLHEME